MNLLRLIRYRFFLFAGLFPYFLGQSLAYRQQGVVDWSIFLIGFLGVVFVLTAVELFNEYFDDRSGGDRVFSLDKPLIPGWFYAAGLAAILLGFLIGLYLAYKTGWPILLFCFLGFLAAYFYVGPPVRWAYRGLGEIVIALSYGPVMVLGSFYIQAGRIDAEPLLVSFVPGLCIFCLAILNEIPDFYQDKLIGKRNLVVRLGRARAIGLLKLVLAGLFVYLVLLLALRIVSLPVAVVFVLWPILFRILKRCSGDYDNPQLFCPAVNWLVINYIVVVLILTASFI